ncbi:phage tail length tape measure family protein [Caulobacter sp. 1776]|uniref:phage tail length tape measure family protein n=1 Tax=Caulobacter sp. 1776 TaxID=3156420 RepID=UPI003398CEE0
MCDLNDLISECKKAAGAANELAGAQKKLDGQARVSAEQMGKLKDATKGFISAISSGESPLKALAAQGPALTEVFVKAVSSGAPLKDLLGGIVEAASPIAGVSAPVAGVAIALSAVASAAADAQKQSAAFSQLAQGIGRDVGMTGGQLQALADAAADAAHASITDAENWTQAYVRMGVSNSAVLAQAVTDTKGLAQAIGVDGAQASQLLGAALANPIANLDALARATGGFDYATRESIQSMARRGELAQADALILKEVESRTASTAGKVTTLSGAYDRAATSIGNYLQKMAKIAFTEPDAAAVEETYSVFGYNPAAEKRKAAEQKTKDANVDKTVGAAARAAHEIADPKERQIKDLTDLSASLSNVITRGAGALKEAGLTKAQALQDIQTLNGRIADLGKAGGSSAARAVSLHAAASPSPEYRGGDAIQAVKSAELSAQLSVTKNVEKIAKLKRDQVDVEFKTQQDRLKAQIKSGEINEADGAFIQDKYKSIASAKEEAIEQERSAQLLQAEVARRQGHNAYLDQMDRFTADTVSTAEERNRIELEALKRRHELEAFTLQSTNAQKIRTGEIDWVQGLVLGIEQYGLQQAETQAVIRKQTIDAEKHALDVRVAGLQNTIDLAEGEKVLARSAGATRAIDARILDLKHQQEVAAQLAIVNGTGANPEQKRDAERRIAILNENYANQVKAAQRLDVSYGDMSTALKNAASALDQKDWLGATKSLFDAFETFALKMRDSGASLESKIGAIAGLANGLGSMIGGKTGAALSGAGSGAAAGFQIGGAPGAIAGAVLGGVTGLLGASAAKAQAKIDALMKAQQELQAKQKESSGAIEKSLGLAGQYQNTDLDYSNAILASLRSIDSKVGVVAAGIARGISSGALMNTSGLGLGTTSTKAGLGGALVGGAIGGIAGFGVANGVTALAVGGAMSAGGISMGLLSQALGLAGPIGIAIGAVGAIVGALTKTKKTVEVLDQGLAFTAQTFGQISTSGLVGSQYADLLTTKKTSFAGIGLSTKVSTSTVTSAVDPALLAQIGDTIELLGEGVIAAAKTFGDDVGQAAKAALQSVSLDLGKLSLKDLKPDEIETAINALFDNVADDLAAAGLPGLQALAKAGEGAFEALTRLATEYKTVDAVLASVGMDFKSGGIGSLEARKGLLDRFGGLDAFTSQTAFFGEHFLTDEDRLKPIKASVVSGLAAIGQPADLSREGFKALVQSQNLSTPEGAELYKTLMALAPAFDKVATAAENAKAAVADKAKSIQDRIDDLVMTPAQKLAKSRAAEEEAVKALNASLLPLLKTLWDVEDAAQAAADAKALASSRSNALADLLDAQGLTEQAKKIRRDLTLVDVEDPVQRDYMRRAWAAQDAAEKVSAARDVLTQAYQREHDAIEATKDRFKELSTSLRAFGASLTNTIAGADLATRYRMARQTFQATAAMARLGDADAMGRLQADGEAFTTASRDYVSTSQDYLRDVGLVRSAVDEAADTADRQVSIAERQLEALDKSVEGLIQINASVVSVRDAIAGLQGALAAANAAGVVSVGGSSLGLSGGGTTSGGSGSGGVDLKRTLDGKYYYDSMLGFLAYTESQHDPQYYPNGVIPALTPGTESYSLYQTYLARDKDKASYLNYATGGSFEVGGSGPPDSKLFNLALSPGEAVNVQRADQKNDKSLINELRALRQELADLRATSARIATSNDKMERTLTNVTEGGRAMQTQAAA